MDGEFYWPTIPADSFDFFGLNQNLIWPWSKFEKISIIFLRFLPEFRFSNISARTERTQNQKNVHFVLMYRCLDSFFGYFTKIVSCTGWAMWASVPMISSLLSIRGNDLIANWVYAERIFAYAQPTFKFWQFLHGHPNACWANAERISSHAEHMRLLNIRPFHYWLSSYAEMFKSRIYGPNRIWLQALEAIRIRFLQQQKKYVKKCHACVILTSIGGHQRFLSSMNVNSCTCPPLSVFLDLECDLNPGILCCQCKTKR